MAGHDKMMMRGAMSDKEMNMMTPEEEIILDSLMKAGISMNTALDIMASNKVDSMNKDLKIIHPGTDCEIDDDDYGNSKREATDYLLREGKNTKIIKTSIIGHELQSNVGLLDWFLKSQDKVSGYCDVQWNGNTTLQWAKICHDLMLNQKKYGKLIIPSTECISKYTLLQKIKEL